VCARHVSGVLIIKRLESQIIFFALFRYKIDDLSADDLFLVSVTLILCWETDGTNCKEHVIFDNALLPKPLCNWNQPYRIPGTYII
jgi:hypothetical protein